MNNIKDDVSEFLGIADRKRSSPPNYSVSFEYTNNYGKLGVQCCIKSESRNQSNYMSYGADDNEAFQKCILLKDQINALNIEYHPTDSDQKHENGYFHKTFEQSDRQFKISWKRKGSIFYISHWKELDKFGFTVLPHPIDISPDHFKYCKDDERCSQLTPVYVLSEGESMYAWNDIRCLSGSAGILIAKDGQIIKEYCMMLS